MVDESKLIFVTTAAQRDKLLEARTAMLEAGIDREFVRLVVDYGWLDQGIFELAEGWLEGEKPFYRGLCIELLIRGVRDYHFWKGI